MAAKARVCELCNQEAHLFCDSDSAFLCIDCDSSVHNANFLVARHFRRFLCSRCPSLSQPPFSGPRSPLSPPFTCLSCSPDAFSGADMDSVSSSSSSSTLSCTTHSDRWGDIGEASLSSSAARISDVKADIPARFSSEKFKRLRNTRTGQPPRVEEEGKPEVIFANWCKRMGQNGNLIVSRVASAMRLCTERLGKTLPLRVCLAASFWFGMKYRRDKSVATRQNLRTLEEISGVPAKLIAAVEIQIEHLCRVGRPRRDLEEGWDECST